MRARQRGVRFSRAQAQADASEQAEQSEALRLELRAAALRLSDLEAEAQRLARERGPPATGSGAPGSGDAAELLEQLARKEAELSRARDHGALLERALARQEDSLREQRARVAQLTALQRATTGVAGAAVTAAVPPAQRAAPVDASLSYSPLPRPHEAPPAAVAAAAGGGARGALPWAVSPPSSPASTA